MGEREKTQTWIEFAVKCDYLQTQVGQELDNTYNSILDMLVNMINNSEEWIISKKQTN